MGFSSYHPFSIVIPVKSEYQLLRSCLTSCYTVDPDEVIVCLDEPPNEKTLETIHDISNKLGWSDRTKIITVPRNPEYRFHQAWVRREGFRQAKHDRILTVDVDLIINKNVLKALSLVGKDNVGFVSCLTTHSTRGLFGLWRHIAFRIVNKISPSFTGLYALWRPYWLDSEDESIKSLENPTNAIGGLALVGEDAFLHNCMQSKHRCIHLSDYGGKCIRNDCNDLPRVQFEIGRHYAKKYNIFKVILRSILFARPHYLRGYLYQKKAGASLPVVEPKTYPYSDTVSCF
ncbi:MAG: glycosyltransferase [Nitrosotalea sp.]